MSSLSNRPLKALALFVEACVFALFAVAVAYGNFHPIRTAVAGGPNVATIHNRSQFRSICRRGNTIPIICSTTDAVKFFR